MNQSIVEQVEKLVSENLEGLNEDRTYGDPDKDKARRNCVEETLKFLEVLNSNESQKMEYEDKRGKRSLEERKADDVQILEEEKLRDPWRKVIELSKVLVPAVVSIGTLGIWMVRTRQMLELNETGTIHTRTSLENLNIPRFGK